MENRLGVSYCASCGQRLVADDEATLARPGSSAAATPCPRCGASNRQGAAFCSSCGFNIRLAVPAAGDASPSPPAAPETAAASRPTRAWLGPLVLLVAAAGFGVAWFLPFFPDDVSLADMALGPDGYGVAFWTAYPGDGNLLKAAYFGLLAPLPVLAAVLVGLAGVGVVRAMPGRAQRVTLGLAGAWCLGVATGFVVVEVGSGLGADLIGLLRGLSPAGLIAFLSGLIGAIGAVTRIAGG